MSAGLKGSAGFQAMLLKPFRIAAILAIAALIVSLGFLAFTAWTSAQRLDPLERHLAHLQALQQSSFDIQELVIRHFEEQSDPAPAEIRRISEQLKALLQSEDHLHPDTPDRIRQAADFIDSPAGNIKAGLLAALTVVRQTIAQENDLQRVAVRQTREAAHAELVVAAGALLLAPAVAILMLVYLRRRSFRSINQLSGLLENVGNLNFKTTTEIAKDDPFARIYERYNEMAEKLRKAAHAADERAADLENQVRAASETLLRQQAELESSARLAAIGEFSARLAHELRNPISGISIALHNMEAELEDPDHKDRIVLIAEEMDRVTRLLNSLLASSTMQPETPMRISTTSLVGDVVRLFSYQLPPQIEIHSQVEDRHCVLPRDTIRQVLLNLLKNARDAIAENAGEIRVTMHRTEGLSRLIVTDSGPGYPGDLLKHGIRPFQTGKTTGSGLGLTVIKRLVTSAGGDIYLTNAENGGASAVVTIPCED